MRLENCVADERFVAGVVVAEGVGVAPSPAELAGRIDALVAERAGEEFPPAAVKAAIREMLRRGGFRPAGRNKPASEYLAQAAREGRFPRINNLVDINNLLSLQTGLPISMLDLDAVGGSAEIRHGRAGEKYVFNSAGQEIDLEGLVCLCRVDGGASVPLGNPIKDSMAGKLRDGTRSIVAVVYSSMEATSEGVMEQLLAEFAELLRQHAGAGSCDHFLARRS